MKIKPFILRLVTLVSLLGVLSAAAPARAAGNPAADDNIYNYLQLMRSDFNSAKVGIINRVMKLSEPDAQKFWPIYSEYEKALGEQAINRAEFITEFVKSSRDRTLDNARAREMARRWFKMQRARLDLVEKYHRKIEKALSSLHAGQFLQIENQLMIFIDLTIASEMPLVNNP